MNLIILIKFRSISNRIIATQLYSELAKNLILTDPHRIKTTADTIPVKFHVPVGCQIITIYIPNGDYLEMCASAERARGMCIAPDSNTNTYHVQFKKKLMKRDKSMVFTNPIPEEVVDGGSSSSAAVEVVADTTNIPCRTDDVGKLRPHTLSQRPTHLPLRFKNITSKDIPESGFSSSITFDEHDSFPQFIGRTSVCSTPMTENKLLQGNILPICGNPFGENGIVAKIAEEEKSVVESDLREASTPPMASSALDKFNRTFNELPDNFLHSLPTHANGQPMRSKSLIDISGTFRKFIRQLSVKPLGAGITNFMNDFDRVADGRKYYPLDMDAVDSINKQRSQLNNYLENWSHDYDGDAVDDIEHKHLYKTITDPTYPVFNSSGQPISHYLFEAMHNQLNVKNIGAEKPALTNERLPVMSEKPSTKPVLKAIEKPMAPPTSGHNANRKSLSLPLKSLTTNAGDALNMTTPATDSANNRNILMKAEDRRRMSGIQLTPLITKLSILAMTDERSSGFSSWDTTPGIEIATPIDSVKMFRRRSSIKGAEMEQTNTSDSSKSSSDIESDGQMRKVELFVCGQNNMTMMLVMQESFSQKQENIQALVSCYEIYSFLKILVNIRKCFNHNLSYIKLQFDVCIAKLPRLEQNLNQILNVNINNEKTDGKYSYFYVDNEWDTMHRDGPWTNSDLTSMEHIRHDLTTNPKLHSIIVR